MLYFLFAFRNEVGHDMVAAAIGAIGIGGINLIGALMGAFAK